MRQLFRLLGRMTGKGLFKGTAFTLGVLAIFGIWAYDASYIVAAMDLNLHLIKAAASLLPAGYSSKVEAAIRLSAGLEHFLVYTEIVVAVKLFLLVLGSPFRILFRTIRNHKRKETNVVHRNRTARTAGNA